MNFNINCVFGIVIMLFTNCANNSTVIKGRLPSDDYDKQAVYWVPLKEEHPMPVDSSHIDKNAFQLVISPRNRNKMGIVRLRPEYRLDLQDILIFTEPGTIHIDLDKNSSSSGTPLNQTLQQWKEKKRTYDSTAYSLRRSYNNEQDELEKARFQSNFEENKEVYRIYMDSLIERNKDNPVGQFIGSLMNKSE
jgi:hypothetical protein